MDPSNPIFEKPASSDSSEDPLSFKSSPSPQKAVHLRPWRKLLYIKQEYPDNYVDESFLENLQKNVNFQSYEYPSLIRESTVITEHVSSVLIFVAVFIQLYHGHLDPHLLVGLGTAFMLVGGIIWEWRLARPEPIQLGRTEPVADRTAEGNTPPLDQTTHSSELVANRDDPTGRLKSDDAPRRVAPRLHLSFVKATVIFFLTLLGLSPILRTLTEDISSDSIWAMSVCLFVTNILFHDYGSGPTYSLQFPGSVALNAAVFACVLLASRLSSNLHVFGFMAFALEWFALFPIFRRYLKRIMPLGHLVQTGLLVAVTFVLFWPIARAIAIFYMIAMFCLTFLCPIWLIWVQRYKNEIHGPWDEARPKVRQFVPGHHVESR
ncbi:glycosylphosphatidylinositol anchor biosynthesis [Tieghemiomyces parasiticus]|uniref:Glycosylphosphatidylinositol anchor biosynthesis n=1 Tax=Tieghemiomyces parasiticus TaxID=78921 RepID=A0A9W8AGL2_9FUNG|nr:glycosylphosphatidylinositol anchor biosynthesis [Tieghemiomyces parasiticus]